MRTHRGRLPNFGEPNFPLEVVPSLSNSSSLTVDSRISAPFTLSVFLRVIFKMPASLRTFAPLLRTARLSLRQTQNPLVSLQRQSRTPVLNFARTYAVFERNKPHVNIGTALWALPPVCGR